MQQELIPLLPKIKTLLDTHVVSSVDYEKRTQYSEARRNQAYWQGNQYLIPVVYDQYTIDWRDASGNLKWQPDAPRGAYDYVRNQIRGDGKKFVAVLGQRAPNVTAVADNLDDEQATRAARAANHHLARLRSKWDVEKIQRRLALSVWIRGTTFGHVRWVANARKYGVREEPVYAEVPVPMPSGFQCSACAAQSPEMGACPGCGKFLQPEEALPPQMVPQVQQVDVKRYPKGAPELSLETVLRVTTPFYGTGIETLPWLWVEWEEHQAIILAAYDDGNHPEAMKILWELRNQTSDVMGATTLSTTGRAARDAASSPHTSYQVPRKDRWAFSLYYLRPEMFMYLDEHERAQVLSQFPKGAKLTMVEDRIIDMENVDLSDEWSVCFPEPNESMFPDALCKDYMHAQDLLNDTLNITAETAERGIGFTVYDPQVLNKKYFKDNPASPGEMIPAIPGAGHRLQEAFHTPPRPELSGDLIQWGDAIVGWAREITGILPALFGGEAPVQTAYQASRQLNQALMQLSPVWNEMRSFWRQTFMNGLRALAEFEPDAQDLQFDGWHLDVEEPIPMTWGQIRDYVTMLLGQNPQAWPLMGLTHPSNLSIVNTALGLKGWTVPNEREREAILDTIRQLLREQPVEMPPQIDPMTGMPMPPGPPQPSIPPDDLEHMPQLVVDVVREWLAGDDGRTAKTQNPVGYANVMAWGRAYLQMTMPPPPVPGGPGGPGPDPAPESAPVPGGQPLPQGSRDMQVPTPPAPPSVTRPQ